LKKFSLSCNLRSHVRTHHSEYPLDFSSSSYSENRSLSVDEVEEEDDMIDVEIED
jgi:hypothetical protein